MSYRMIHEPANVPKPKAEHDVRRIEEVARKLCASRGGKWGRGTHRKHWMDEATSIIEKGRGIATMDALTTIFGYRRVK